MFILILALLAVIAALILWTFVKTIIWLGIVAIVLVGAGWVVGFLQGRRLG